MREKLIELLRKTRYEYRRYIGMKDMEKRMAKTDEEFLAIDDSIVGEIPFCADHLIANGVTLAEDNNVPSKWIPVSERLPDEDGKFLVHKNLFGMPHISTIRFAKVGEKVCAYDLKGLKNVWYDYDSETGGYFQVKTVTHWMPLPEPPKGE